MTEKADDKGTGEKPKKVYKLKNLKLCGRCQKPLTSDKDEICAPCALLLAQEKAAKEGTAKKALVCEKCGAPCSTESTTLCDKCLDAVTAASEPTTLDVMKEVLAEVERQNLEDDKIAEEVKQKFRVHDFGTANWAAGKIAMWQNEITRRKAQAAEFIAEAERNARRLNFLFKPQLEVWAKQNIPQDKKSIKLPLATLKFSDTQDKIEIVDEKKAVAWATVNLPDAVEMSASLQMLKDHWIASETKDPATGEVKRTIPDGCNLIPKTTNFKIE